MRPRFSIRGSVRPSVGQLVDPSVGHAFVKNKENQHFWANKCPSRYIRFTRCLFASLKDGLSVIRSVSLSILSSREYQWKSAVFIKARVKKILMYPRHHTIIHSNMRTHRWPYWPCFFALTSGERGTENGSWIEERALSVLFLERNEEEEGRRLRIRSADKKLSSF